MADSNLNLVKIFEDVLKSERAIVVTLPSSEQWEDYQKEMDAVKDYSQVMNLLVQQLEENGWENLLCV